MLSNPEGGGFAQPTTAELRLFQGAPPLDAGSPVLSAGDDLTFDLRRHPGVPYPHRSGRLNVEWDPSVEPPLVMGTNPWWREGGLLLSGEMAGRLWPVLGSFGQFVEMETPEGLPTLWYFQCLAVSDDVDMERSEVERLPSGPIRSFRTMWFSSVPRTPVFLVRGFERGPLFLSEAVVDLIRAYGGSGTTFRPALSPR